MLPVCRMFKGIDKVDTKQVNSITVWQEGTLRIMMPKQ